jgi:hypothetical protein
MINGQELSEFYQSPDLVGDFKRRKLECLENVITMNQTRVCKKIFEIRYNTSGEAQIEMASSVT